MAIINIENARLLAELSKILKGEVEDKLPESPFAQTIAEIGAEHGYKVCSASELQPQAVFILDSHLAVCERRIAAMFYDFLTQYAPAYDRGIAKIEPELILQPKDIVFTEGQRGEVDYEGTERFRRATSRESKNQLFRLTKPDQSVLPSYERMPDRTWPIEIRDEGFLQYVYDNLKAAGIKVVYNDDPRRISADFFDEEKDPQKRLANSLDSIVGRACEVMLPFVKMNVFRGRVFQKCGIADFLAMRPYLDGNEIEYIALALENVVHDQDAAVAYVEACKKKILEERRGAN